MIYTYSVQIISIGKTTAQALKDAGVDANQVCSQPTPECVLQALKSIFPDKL